MNIGILKNLQIVITRPFFCRSATMLTPSCSGGKGALYGPIIVCVGPVPMALPSCAHMHLGPEAQ